MSQLAIACGIGFIALLLAVAAGAILVTPLADHWLSRLWAAAVTLAAAGTIMCVAITGAARDAGTAATREYTKQLRGLSAEMQKTIDEWSALKDKAPAPEAP